jgi:hypothetical protein
LLEKSHDTMIKCNVGGPERTSDLTSILEVSLAWILVALVCQ